MEKVRKYIRFEGSVQGVGFRYRAYHSALRYGATGWVHNAYDGSVEMEIEGTEDVIDSVILSIEQGEFVRIEKMTVKSLPLLNDRTFSVR